MCRTPDQDAGSEKNAVLIVVERIGISTLEGRRCQSKRELSTLLWVLLCISCAFMTEYIMKRECILCLELVETPRVLHGKPRYGDNIIG